MHNAMVYDGYALMLYNSVRNPRGVDQDRGAITAIFSICSRDTELLSCFLFIFFFPFFRAFSVYQLGSAR